MISVESPGSFKRTQDFLNKMAKGDLFNILEHYGSVGVSALANATPVDSGLSANSWTYVVIKKPGKVAIEWHNTNVVSGTPVVIMLVYGHGTGTGGWVEGRDFINPTIQPLFDQITDEVWKQVTNG